jgi:regulator of cell morphogenesis and NO signaling
MNKNIVAFSSKMKMADIISAEPKLILVIEHLNIKLGFGEDTVEDICRRYGLSAELFLCVCNIFTYGEFVPHPGNLDTSDIKGIIRYLRACHHFYIDDYFPELHGNIHKMMELCDKVSEKTLNKFFDDYENEIRKHFDYEEQTVFPYVEKLLEGKASGKYNIKSFAKHHGDIEEKLNDFKNIIMKYLPESASSPVRFTVLEDIYKIEDDLTAHTIIEDKLLVPMVSSIEETQFGKDKQYGRTDKKEGK